VRDKHKTTADYINSLQQKIIEVILKNFISHITENIASRIQIISRSLFSESNETGTYIV
jgi:hypothetical protein